MTIQKLPGAAIVPGTITVTQLDSSTATVISTGGGPKITAISITNNAYTVLDDTAVSVSGGYIKITGTGFVTGCTVIIGAIVATSVSFISSTEVRAQVPAQSASTYTVYLVNPDGGVGIRVNGLNYSATPTWSTTSPLPGGVKDTAISIQLVASSNTAVTYALQAGSTLPTGLTLTSGGLLSGTVSSISVETTYNFTIVATDGENQDTPQAFQITIVVRDPYYKYVTLHLPGTGTNLAQNNTFLDSSSNNFAITRNGNTTQGTFSPFSQTGWSNYFDGSGDCLTIAKSSSLVPGGDFTIECWVNTPLNGGQVIGSHEAGTAANWIISVGGDGKIYMYIPSKDIYNSFASTQAIQANTWSHIVASRVGTTLYLGCNGELTTHLNINTSLDYGANLPITIGADQNGDESNYIGYISDIRIINGTGLYSGSSYTVPTAPLTAVAGTSLLTCQSNRFKDNSSNNFSISRGGDARVVAFSPFAPTQIYTPSVHGGSGYFDGTGDYLTAPTNAAFSFNADFTIECWVYGPSLSTSQSLYIVNASGSYLALNVGTTSVDVYLNTSGIAFSSSATIPNNSWNHVAMVRSGSTVTIYVNGNALPTTGSSSATLGSSSSVFSIAGLSGNYLGYLSNLRVIKGTAVYTGAFTPPTKPLAASGADSAGSYPSTTNVNTSFASSACSLLLNFTNAGILDATAKNDLETVGDAKISTAQSKWGGGSMSFDGTGDYLRGPNSPLLNFNTGDFTVEAWVYTSSVVSYATIIDTSVGGGGSGGWFLEWSQRGIVFYDGSGAASTIAAFTIATGQWYHIAASRASTSLRLFVNGTQQGSTASNSTNISGTNAVTVGATNGTPSYLLNGYIQDLRITRGYARYTANFTAPTAAFPTL
jgi:hypothetical protein